MQAHAVMYIAKDLEFWVTTEPHYYAERVTVDGKAFIRLTPQIVDWFKTRIARAEAACANGKLDLDAFGRIIKAFCPVYEFAVEAGLIPDPVTKQVRQRPAAPGAKVLREVWRFNSPREVAAGQDFVGQTEKTGTAAAAAK